MIDINFADIVYELNKVNWKSPWAPLEAIGAFVVGVLEGAADFFTFGMISSMRKLSAEVKANKKLLDMLGKADNYYNLTHDKDGRGVWLKTIITKNRRNNKMYLRGPDKKICVGRNMTRW